MLSTLLTAVAGLIVISASWLAVQRLWQRHFPEDADASGDALAGRGDCQGCHCRPNQCERELAQRTNKPKEVTTHAP